MGDNATIEIHGLHTPQFNPVLEALGRNFAEHDEIGCAVTVYLDGEKAVDLWAGHMDTARAKPWREDTLCIMYSIAKSICATSVHILADRGLVDLDAPVADYWPEFAQAGKENVKVRHVISHYCGICFADAGQPGDIFNYDQMIKIIEQQAPAWPAGTKGAYNTVNIGYLAGEIVRRVTGTPIQQFVQENICQPLGVDYQIGVQESDLERIADLTPNTQGNAMMKQGGTEETHLSRAWKPLPKPFGTDAQNGREFRLAGIPSFGGFGEARAMARIYAMLGNGGELDGVRILSREAIKRATTLQWEDDVDGMTGRPMRYAMGYAKSTPVHAYMGPNPNAFGHLGSGGARVFADPARNVAACFVSNYQSEGMGIGVRTEAVVDAIFASL
jgi:CubicO group peptidase (beta-lactamase class C family)